MRIANILAIGMLAAAGALVGLAPAVSASATTRPATDPPTCVQGASPKLLNLGWGGIHWVCAPDQ